jgi:hypothetical protein
MIEKHHQYTGGKALRPAAAVCAILTALLSSACGSPSPAPIPQQRAFTKPVSFAILEDYDKGHDLGQVARDFALFRELGVPVWRGSFGWDDYEPEAGQFDLKWLTRFVRIADSMGITLRPYLGYTPAWAARDGEDEHAWNDPPRRVADWVRFVDTMARTLRSHSSVRSYEIYNEENVSLWWEGTAPDYALLLEQGAKAIRRADPDAQVLLGGMVWPDVEWLEASCIGGRAPFDVLPFHAYPETWTPDSIRVENYLGASFRQEFIQEANQLCGPKPIWINEAGFATTPGKTEEQQAEWWVRAFATFLAEPRIEHIGIYEIRDQLQGTPVIGDAPNYYLGLIRTDGTPKLAFSTIKLLVQLFGSDSVTVADHELRIRVTSGSKGELFHHLFVRPDRRQIIFVWDRSGSPTLNLELTRPGSRVTALAIDGKASVWTNSDGRVIRQVPLTAGQVRIFEVEP